MRQTKILSPNISKNCSPTLHFPPDPQNCSQFIFNVIYFSDDKIHEPTSIVPIKDFENDRSGIPAQSVHDPAKVSATCDLYEGSVGNDGPVGAFAQPLR
jgi:hypothetical protein